MVDGGCSCRTQPIGLKTKGFQLCTLLKVIICSCTLCSLQVVLVSCFIYLSFSLRLLCVPSFRCVVSFSCCFIKLFTAFSWRSFKDCHPLMLCPLKKSLFRVMISLVLSSSVNDVHAYLGPREGWLRGRQRIAPSTTFPMEASLAAIASHAHYRSLGQAN